tara:strand:- start:52 stop:1161 length:1110 start_codon:yes stop_codon:yes gene_type:complete
LKDNLINADDNEQFNQDSLVLDTEEDEPPYVEYDISVSPSDPSLELLTKQFEREDVIIPFYQRNFVWNIQQASKLIESFLMGLPVPQIFLYENANMQLEVIDGQQRLMSVKYFFEGYFGEADSKGRRTQFKLKGLAERSEYNGKSFSELETKDQRKLRNSTLRAINIKQLNPKNAGDSVFHIFERLNTGGTQLKPQEIRNAVYRGDIIPKLKELNDMENWRKILGLTKPDKNQKDVELVLRVFSLFGEWENYEKPMLKHLNTFMDNNRKFNSPKAQLFTDRFEKSTALINCAIKKPFRPKKVLNSAVLEAVIIAVMEDENIDCMMLKENYPKLLLDEGFMANISGSTTDTALLHNRIQIAKRVLGNVII